MTISHCILYFNKLSCAENWKPATKTDHKSSGMCYDNSISGQFCDNNLKQIHLDKSCQESLFLKIMYIFYWTTQ